jgi:hypothetical protein
MDGDSIHDLTEQALRLLERDGAGGSLCITRGDFNSGERPWTVSLTRRDVRGDAHGITTVTSGSFSAEIAMRSVLKASGVQV